MFLCAYALKLPKKLQDQKWKAPHVTILHKTRSWRIGLRNGAFLDKEPPAGDVPDELVEFVRKHMGALAARWDAMYPENAVESE